MKIVLRQAEYDFFISMLNFVDGRSYDPVYKNLIERIEKTCLSQESDMVIFLEETEIYNTLDAINEYIGEAESGNYEDNARKLRIEEAEEFEDLINNETGITL